MRVLIPTVGSRGDVQPFVDLAAVLAERGHDVTLATHGPFRESIESEGLTFAPLPGDPMAVLETEEARQLLRSGRGLLGFGRQFVKLLKPWFWQLVEAVEPLHASKPDVVVYSPLSFPSWHIAQAQGTPAVFATLQPLQRTRAFPAVTLGGSSLGGALNWATHIVNEQIFWQPLRRSVNRWREHHLGLPPMPLAGPFQQLRERGEPIIAAFSSTLVPRPDDWPVTVSTTGAWHRDGTKRLSERTLAFLGDGPPPVYVGFGSMSDAEAERLSAVAIDAAQLIGRRLVLSSGWAGLSGVSADDMLVIGDEPHDALFPRCEIIVHHGGAGTSHTAARSGTPSVVVPYFADQPFWAQRLHAVGIASAPLPRRDITRESLAERLLDASAAKRKPASAKVSHAMQREPGVQAAAATIETHAADAAEVR
jgi:UDP:flavonoid glycosyltransferase YjiC (YdhE family)